MQARVRRLLLPGGGQRVSCFAELRNQSLGAFLQPRGEQARLVLQLGDALGVRRRRRRHRRELALEDCDPLRLRERRLRHQLPVDAHHRLRADARERLRERLRGNVRVAHLGPDRGNLRRHQRRRVRHLVLLDARQVGRRLGDTRLLAAGRVPRGVVREERRELGGDERRGSRERRFVERTARDDARRRLRRRPPRSGRRARQVSADRRRPPAERGGFLFAPPFRLARANIRQVLLHGVRAVALLILLLLRGSVGNLDAVLVRGRGKGRQPVSKLVPRRRRAPLGVARVQRRVRELGVVDAQRVAERRRRHGRRARARGRNARRHRVGRGRVAARGRDPREIRARQRDVLAAQQRRLAPGQNGEVRRFAQNRVVAAGARRSSRSRGGSRSRGRARVIAQERPAGRVLDARLEVRARRSAFAQLRDLLQLALGDARRRKHERVSSARRAGVVEVRRHPHGTERVVPLRDLRPLDVLLPQLLLQVLLPRALHLLHRRRLERALVERRGLRGALLRDVVKPRRGLSLKRNLRVVVQPFRALRAFHSLDARGFQLALLL
mmetsp:Transcript_12589/g.52764  ORF Transcript_12589/g.52764 Transcript_12589/m.52764 type:complete len:555 (-) Transcript_12589:705-2369(-)